MECHQECFCLRGAEFNEYCICLCLGKGEKVVVRMNLLTTSSFLVGNMYTPSCPIYVGGRKCFILQVSKEAWTVRN